MLRGIVAVILGMVVCEALFGGLALTTMQVWPDYAVHGRLYIDRQIFTFTSIMAAMNLVYWLLSFTAAGWTTTRIARHRGTIWALAGLMQIYAIYVHVLRSWSTFPWWYNLVVVFSVMPAVVLGKVLATKTERTRVQLSAK